MGDTPAGSDPILELASALVRDGSPPLAWVVRWSHGDADPVAAAWAASDDPYAMLALLDDRLGGRYVPPGARAALIRIYVRMLGGWHGLRASDDEDEPPEGQLATDAIRRAVPVPPTLADLIAARTRTRQRH